MKPAEWNLFIISCSFKVPHGKLSRRTKLAATSCCSGSNMATTNSRPTSIMITSHVLQLAACSTRHMSPVLWVLATQLLVLLRLPAGTATPNHEWFITHSWSLHPSWSATCNNSPPANRPATASSNKPASQKQQQQQENGSIHRWRQQCRQRAAASTCPRRACARLDTSRSAA